MARRNPWVYLIVGGPSEMDLVFALFQKEERYTVVFRFASEEVAQRPENTKAYSSVEIVINSLEREDGSGQSFSFTGYPRALIRDDGKRIKLIGSRGAEGHYSTKDRRGSITF